MNFRNFTGVISNVFGSTLLRRGYAANPNVFKRAQRGLYHGCTRLTGNNISFSHRKTRRIWLPNIQKKNFYSELLDNYFSIRVSTTALRCIDKAGGLDNYLLYTRDETLASELGLKMKELLKERFFEVTGVKFKRYDKERNESLLRTAFRQRELAAATTASATTTDASNSQ